MTLFYRLTTDQQRTDIPLRNLFAGPQPSACWLIGGGPSLTKLPLKKIRNSPLPKLCLNLAGSRLLRPTFWTSYDPTARFHRSIYLDPSVMKFVHRRRALDLVPETTFKVCECPNLFFFDRDAHRSYANFLSPSHTNIVDWSDSFVQAIDILYQLGFRRIYLAGCEMMVQPSTAQREFAAAGGVEYQPQELLADFLKKCERKGITRKELEQLDPPTQYHFGETKPFRAAINTDRHYFRIAQFLRLSRTVISQVGLQLVSVTPDSRLNQIFEYRPAKSVLEDIAANIGNPKTEPLTGLYTNIDSRQPAGLGPMRDFPSPCQSSKRLAELPPPAAETPELQIEQEGLEPCGQLQEKLKALPEQIPQEEG